MAIEDGAMEVPVFNGVYFILNYATTDKLVEKLQEYHYIDNSTARLLIGIDAACSRELFLNTLRSIGLEIYKSSSIEYVILTDQECKVKTLPKIQCKSIW